jgi:hypothetical protein
VVERKSAVLPAAAGVSWRLKQCMRPHSQAVCSHCTLVGALVVVRSKACACYCPMYNRSQV